MLAILCATVHVLHNHLEYLAERLIVPQGGPGEVASKVEVGVGDTRCANRTKCVRQVGKSIATFALCHHYRHHLNANHLVRLASFQKVDGDVTTAFFLLGYCFFVTFLRRSLRLFCQLDVPRRRLESLH